jgi:uncharacterized protein YcbX
MSVQGRVVELRTYPVKSMGTVAQPATEVTTAGLLGDRDFAVVDVDREVVSARRLARLLDVRAVATADGPELYLPGRSEPVAGSTGDDALSTYLGLTVHLERADQPAHQVAPIHLVSRQAMDAASGPACEDAPGDLAAARANIVVDLDAGSQADPGLERGWIGRQIHLGAVVLRVTTAPKHCLGVYAEVVTPGPLRVGDPVEVADAVADSGETSATTLLARG